MHLRVEREPLQTGMQLEWLVAWCMLSDGGYDLHPPLRVGRSIYSRRAGGRSDSNGCKRPSRVSPKLLAQAILHRRERIAEMIPSDLEERKEELQTAEPMAKTAREERDKINSKVANLKNERNTAQKEARQLFERGNEIREQLIAEGGLKNPDPKWAKDKLSAKLQSLENQLETSAGTHKTEEKLSMK